MNLQLYDQYLSLKQQRKKQEAEEALRGFIASFQSDQEREQWVRDFLASHGERYKVSHPIYINLVFPVLLAGYDRRDIWSTLWLVRTIQNVYGFKPLHAAIGHKSAYDLLREVHAWEPSFEANLLLLENILQWFRYCEHEWPSGILYGHDGATPEQCQEILQEVAFARGLDEEGNFQAFLTEFEQKVQEYQARLARRIQLPRGHAVPLGDGI